MNIKEIDQSIFNYLVYIFRDLSILLYRNKLKEPYFQASHAISEKSNWNHSFNASERLCAKVQIEKLDKEVILYNMLHLLIHSYNKENGKRDMSKSAGGRYHRAEFAMEAHKIGITCRRDNNYGYQIESINVHVREECINIIERYYKNIEELLQLYFVIEDISESPRVRQSYIKYRCPVCKKVIKAVNGTYVICGVCNATFEKI